MKARIGAGFMIWLAAVVSVAGIAWLAIGTAGKQVTADPIAAPLPTEFPPSPSPTRTAGPTRTTPIKDDVSPTSTRVGSSPVRSTDPVATTSPGRPDRSGRAERPNIRVTPVTSTYNTAAGRLRVRCEGREITLDGGYAQPAPGWAVSVQSGGPDSIQVTFDTDKTPPLTVVAECGNGRPRFREALAPASAPTASVTASRDWRFTNQQRPTTPAPPPTTAATTPPCAPAPSATRPSATATPAATVPAMPTATPTATPTVPAECPQVEATATDVPTSAPTPGSPERPWSEDWTQREWSQRNR